MLPILLAALAAPAYAQQQTPGAVFTRYCVTCHNATAKVAGLVINPADLSNVGANPELWEKDGRRRPHAHEFWRQSGTARLA